MGWADRGARNCSAVRAVGCRGCLRGWIMQAAHIKYLRRELEEYQALLDCLDSGKNWKAQALRLRHQQTADALAKALWDISALIASIEDAELRLIFELRYFRGYTWKQVANELPVRISADAARVKHDRFMRRYESIKKEGSTG